MTPTITLLAGIICTVIIGGMGELANHRKHSAAKAKLQHF